MRHFGQSQTFAVVSIRFFVCQPLHWFSFTPATRCRSNCCNLTTPADEVTILRFFCSEWKTSFLWLREPALRLTFAFREMLRLPQHFVHHLHTNWFWDHWKRLKYKYLDSLLFKSRLFSAWCNLRKTQQRFHWPRRTSRKLGNLGNWPKPLRSGKLPCFDFVLMHLIGFVCPD